jgi:hypothetical protein
MIFGISVEHDHYMRSRVPSVLFLNSILKYYLLDKDYGNGINRYFIGFVGIKTTPGYEHWYQERKPRYRSYIAEDEVTLINQFSYDIKIDMAEYDMFITLSDGDCLNHLGHRILISLSYLDKLPKKVKNFDKERFKQDMKCFFNTQSWFQSEYKSQYLEY